MKIKFTIEKVISQDFEMEVSSVENAYDEIRKAYKEGRIVVDKPQLTEANVSIHDENGEAGDWNNLHV